MKYLRRKRESEIQNEVAELYVRYRKQIAVFVNIHTRGSLIQSTGMVEDIVQDVFLEAVRKYDSFKGHSNPVGWLCQTANYKICECERVLKKLNTVPFDDLEEVEDENASSYAELEIKMLFDAAMTEEEKRRFYRYFLWGWSLEEIAEAECTSVKNMRVKLSRLKKKLLQQVNANVFIVMVLARFLR